MSDNTYGGSASFLENALKSIISPETLSLLLNGTGNTSGNYNVEVTNGAASLSIMDGVDLALVNDSAATLMGLAAATPNANGGYDNIGDLATYVTNDSSQPVTVAATDSAFVELQGAATVEGLSAPLFVVDASHDTSDLKLQAGTGKSFLIGGQGPGHDTLEGSTSTSGAALLVAGSAATTMTGGLGADTLIGGGNSTMTGGSGSGQLLYDFSPNAHDSITAGTGGGETLSVAGGSNVLNDASGTNDTLFAGSGQDTLFGSTNGSTIALYQGNSSVQSAASDTIYVAPATVSHSDTITASTSGLDQVTFQGYSAATVEGLVASAESAPGFTGDSVTINFGTTNGVTQTATLNNVSHIHFN